MNSRRKCRHCGEYKRSDTMLIVPAGAFCNHDHALAYARENRPKALVKIKREHSKRRKDHYTKDAARQRKLTQAACNKLVSLLDKGRDCISCGRPLRGGRYQHASHFKSVGANSALRFDLRNVHLSCVNCNQYKSGNLVGYRDGIWTRYGLAIIDYLDTAPRLKEWTPEELIAMRAEFSAEIRRLERGEDPSRDWRCINQMLNIEQPSSEKLR